MVQSSPSAQGHLCLSARPQWGLFVAEPPRRSTLLLPPVGKSVCVRLHVCICVHCVSSASVQSYAALASPSLWPGLSQPARLWNADRGTTEDRGTAMSWVFKNFVWSWWWRTHTHTHTHTPTHTHTNRTYHRCSDDHSFYQLCITWYTPPVSSPSTYLFFLLSFYNPI